MLIFGFFSGNLSGLTRRGSWLMAGCSRLRLAGSQNSLPHLDHAVHGNSIEKWTGMKNSGLKIYQRKINVFSKWAFHTITELK